MLQRDRSVTRGLKIHNRQYNHTNIHFFPVDFKIAPKKGEFLTRRKNSNQSIRQYNQEKFKYYYAIPYKNNIFLNPHISSCFFFNCQ